jgi:pimeloyl-ACP methyl ester carboxylesterase
VDAATEPIGYLVASDSGDRIHYLDWGGDGRPAVVLIHGLASTAWACTAVARRLSRHRRTIAMDLRGHGLSDAPTATGAYDLDQLVDDVVAVAQGSGAIDPAPLEIAGHGFGAIVAGAAAARLGAACGQLTLVDGGLDDVAQTSGVDVDEFLRGLDEPPEVMRSMSAYLRDRRSWDPATWDADQEQAARATVVETPAGRLVGATRPHALEACVRTMFLFRPAEVLPSIRCPVTAIRRRTPGEVVPGDIPASAPPSLTVVDLEAPGHNLLRYRPDEVTAAILGR